ncbi:MAG TPA: PQ-loop domain-containing transporter [Thermoanaerobaculia bacterium]|nr:PQ-loop domain-containing transporter [Thermoanaerobaculia bacterium]
MQGAPIPKSSTTKFDRLLYAISIITMVMTIPQVFSIWKNRTAEGVSVFTWGTYLISACLWLVHGIRKHDPSIYLACIGWIILDAAIVVGALVFG